MDERAFSTGMLGLASVFGFAALLVLFTLLNPDFDPVHDYVSMLGAVGQPFSMWWNLSGFLSIGLLLAAFGWRLGRVLSDRWTGSLLALFGIGFACTALPVDFANEHSGLSKAHIAAICLGLAAWMFALARMAQHAELPSRIRTVANACAALIGLSLIVGFSESLSEPLVHRLVFLVVFGWTAFVSIWLLGQRMSASSAGRPS
jgi:hypothetical protein